MVESKSKKSIAPEEEELSNAISLFLKDVSLMIEREEKLSNATRSILLVDLGGAIKNFVLSHFFLVFATVSFDNHPYFATIAFHEIARRPGRRDRCREKAHGSSSNLEFTRASRQ